MADFGLMFYNARWYDPTIGRFVQADTVIPGGVQGYDRFAYVSSSPTNNTDPTGHRTCTDDGYCPNRPNLHASKSDDSGDRDSSESADLVNISPDLNGLMPGGIIDMDALAPPLSVVDVSCTGTAPCLKSSTTMPTPGIDPNLPDYYTLQGNIGYGSGQFTVDRYGDVYTAWGVNVGKGMEGWSGSLVAGSVGSPAPNGYAPSKGELQSFLKGAMLNVSGGAVGGGGISWSPSTNLIGYEAGAYLPPQFGLTATWGVPIRER